MAALPQSRPSLTINLSQRYLQQSVGGAYDDRDIIESGVDPLFAFQSNEFQNVNGFLTKQSIGQSDFINNGNGLSAYVAGLNTQPYDSAGISIPAGLS